MDPASEAEVLAFVAAGGEGSSLHLGRPRDLLQLKLCLGCKNRCLREGFGQESIGGEGAARTQLQWQFAEEVVPSTGSDHTLACPGRREECSLSSSRAVAVLPSRRADGRRDPNDEVDVTIAPGLDGHIADPRQDLFGMFRTGIPSVPSSADPAPMLLGANAKPVQVSLNIYDIGTSTQVQVANSCLRAFGTGLFHCGVEVYHCEWSYAATRTGTGSGVFVSEPQACESQTFRESVAMGETKFSMKGVLQLIQVLEHAWPASDYDVLTHNCCHFCNELCEKLGVGPVPSRVINLADASACMVQTWDTFCCKVAAEAGLACDRTAVPNLPASKNTIPRTLQG